MAQTAADLTCACVSRLCANRAFSNSKCGLHTHNSGSLAGWQRLVWKRVAAMLARCLLDFCRPSHPLPTNCLAGNSPSRDLTLDPTLLHSASTKHAATDVGHRIGEVVEGAAERASAAAGAADEKVHEAQVGHCYMLLV